ncbi:MAG: NAD-dependent epimerase/dehydratase family protein [Anaerolineae bacterium]|nr:NAD-dependent epimerase/dehydratase family protein [Anaerolineae bacterium]
MNTLVTGGGGFLGRYIVEQLLARGDTVTIFARGAYPEIVAQGARQVRGDLCDAAAVADACAGMDAVFHVAAKAGVWGAWSDYYTVNVVGTQNVIDGCRRHGVPKLINTSSPSVIFDGTSQVGVDERYPYPTRVDGLRMTNYGEVRQPPKIRSNPLNPLRKNYYESPYPQTKAWAERLVSEAHGPELLTVSLRPHLIIGPRDNHLLPGLLAAARAGTLPQVGDGDNRVDLTYVEDAARAHQLAADALKPGSPVVGEPGHGRVYFISQDEPVVLWPWVCELLADLNIPGPRLHLSLPAARALGAMMEAIYRVLPLHGEPRLTRFLASELAQSHTYDISAAKRDFGYTPQWTMAGAREKTVAWLKGMEGQE